MEKFSEIKYVRPDGEQLISSICKGAEKLHESKNFEEAKAVF